MDFGWCCCPFIFSIPLLIFLFWNTQITRSSFEFLCVFETARLFIYFFFFLPLIVERMMIRVLCVQRDSHYALVEIAIHSGVNDTLLQTRKYIRTPTEVDIIASTVQFFKMTNNIRKKDKVLLHRLFSLSWRKFSRGSQPDATRVDMVCCCSFFCWAITCFCLLICNALQRLYSSTRDGQSLSWPEGKKGSLHSVRFRRCASWKSSL